MAPTDPRFYELWCAKQESCDKRAPVEIKSIQDIFLPLLATLQGDCGICLEVAVPIKQLPCSASQSFCADCLIRAWSSVGKLRCLVSQQDAQESMMKSVEVEGNKAEPQMAEATARGSNPDASAPSGESIAEEICWACEEPSSNLVQQLCPACKATPPGAPEHDAVASQIAAQKEQEKYEKRAITTTSPPFPNRTHSKEDKAVLQPPTAALAASTPAASAAGGQPVGPKTAKATGSKKAEPQMADATALGSAEARKRDSGAADHKSTEPGAEDTAARTICKSTASQYRRELVQSHCEQYQGRGEAKTNVHLSESMESNRREALEKYDETHPSSKGGGENTAKLMKLAVVLETSGDQGQSALKRARKDITCATNSLVRLVKHLREAGEGSDSMHNVARDAIEEAMHAARANDEECVEDPGHSAPPSQAGDAAQGTGVEDDDAERGSETPVGDTSQCQVVMMSGKRKGQECGRLQPCRFHRVSS